MYNFTSYVNYMPANGRKINKANSYYHIHNKGREDRVIFSDREDYETFLSYLNEYLTPPADPTTTKKQFSVQGKTYHGIPHQPKNYHKRIDLLAYSLISNSFHLLIKQNEEGAVEAFVRSLCTRYSIYFNKKYQRTGSLFEGPYKSIHVENDMDVTLLTYYLHKMGGVTSIEKYVNISPPEWTSSNPGIVSYRDFVEKYELDDDQKDLLSKLTFDRAPSIQTPKPVSLEEAVIPTPHKHQSTTKHLEVHQRVPELLTIGTLFLFLLIFGVRNITINADESVKLVVARATNTGIAVDSGQVAGVSIESLEEAYSGPVTNQTKRMIRIKSDDLVSPVMIYSDTEKSNIIVAAGDGAELELVATGAKWTEVKFLDDTHGFVETKYTMIIEGENI